MRLPLEWLREYCSPALGTRALADRLTMTGTKVEAVEHHGVLDPSGFVVGRVLDVEPHPDADRLRVCDVDVGSGEPARIVCGAANVAAGQTVAVARPGAVLSGGVKLEARALRGIVSEGMILAEDELGIGSDHTGIVVLDEGSKDGRSAQPGTALSEVIPIATEVLELEITPNRPDCLGVYGLAREVHAITDAQLGPEPWREDPGSFGDVEGFEVVVSAPEQCPRFTVRLFEEVTIAPSPAWLKARLMAAGQRPINNVVDITNYVMLLTGQPLHAFDADRVEGGHLEVRLAKQGEQLDTLDGNRRALAPGMVAIADAAGVTSLAGIMGGARSEVSPATQRVALEAATWDGPTQQRSSSALGLRSEASTRFEKQLVAEQTLEAQAVASVLMVTLCGARLAPGTIDVGPASSGHPPTPAIRLREDRVERLLGAPIARARCKEILVKLGFEVAEADDGLDAIPPPFRRLDVTREADLIEEVARLDGLDRLPITLPSRRSARGGLTAEQALRRRVEDALAARGVHETLGWSFSAAEHDDRLRLATDDERRTGHVEIANPMAADQRLLRTQLLGSLLDAAARNVVRDQHELRLFELGTVYRSAAQGLPDERRHLAVLLAGPSRPPTWREPRPRPADVFAVKGVLGSLLDELRVPWDVQAERQREPFLHPGRAGAVFVAAERVGWLGELHPEVCAAWGVDEAIAAFELDLDAVVACSLAGGVSLYRDLTSFPSVRQDLAIVVAEEIAAGRVLDVVHGAGGPTLARADIFDVYRGAQAGEGRVSLALALEFRAPDRTLTDAEVAERRAAIIAAVESELGGVARV
ncbi:MAG: phenylalanine--tRNA ligase subunit beta [Solirubrobacteraceae bacterium]|nr:MAG: phenylalanine--tRNA ligase subunit beta [Solirubrobacterales bacterium]